MRPPTYLKVQLQGCLHRSNNEYLSVGRKRDLDARQVINPPHSRRERDGCDLYNIDSSLANDVAPQYLISRAIDNQLAKSEGSPIDGSAGGGVEVRDCGFDIVAFARFLFG